MACTDDPSHPVNATRPKVPDPARAAFLSHPSLNLIYMSKSVSDSRECLHEPIWVGRVAVVGCSDCGEVNWLSENGAMDPSEAIARVFGTYELTGSIDALGGPAAKALVYDAPSSRKRRHLDAFPRHTWLRCGRDLWMSTDGVHLLLATPHRLMYDNLMRGA